MPGNIILKIDGKDVKIRWNESREPTPEDVSYIENDYRQRQRGKSAFAGASAGAKAQPAPKAQPKAQPKRGSSVLDVLFNPVAGAQFAGTVAKQIIPGAFESVAAVAEDVGRGAEFAGKASKAVQRKTGVAGVIPSKMAGVLGGGDPEWQEAYTAAAEEFDLPVMAAGMKQIASAIAGEARSISGSGQLTQGGKQFVEAVKADPLNALLQLGGVDKQTVIDGYAKGDEKALKRIRKALAMAILSGGTAAIGLAAKGASAPAAVARVGKAGAKAIDAGEAGAALVRGLKGGVPDEVAKPFVGYDLSGLPKPKPTSVLDEVLGEPAKKAQKAAQTAAEDAIDGALEYDGTDPNFQRRRIEIDIAEDEELLKMAANMLKNSGETDANGFWAEAIARIESRLAENRKKMDTNGSTDAFNPFTDDPTADPFVPFNPFADDPVTFNQQSVLDEVLAPKTSPAETVSTAPKQAPQMPPTVERVGYRGTRGNQSYGASEGDGVYIAHSPTLAKAFGEVQEIKYRAPSNPFIITKADLVAEDAGDGLRGGINDGDPEWVKIKKEAIREAYAELGDSPTLDKFHPLVSAKITAKLKERGHDALIVDGDDGWTVLFDDAGLVDDAIRANVAQRRPGSVLDEVLDAPAEPTLPTGATPEPTARTVTPDEREYFAHLRRMDDVAKAHNAILEQGIVSGDLELRNGTHYPKTENGQSIISQARELSSEWDSMRLNESTLRWRMDYGENSTAPAPAVQPRIAMPKKPSKQEAEWISALNDAQNPTITRIASKSGRRAEEFVISDGGETVARIPTARLSEETRKRLVVGNIVHSDDITVQRRVQVKGDDESTGTGADTEVLDAPAEPTLPTGATPEPTAQTVTPDAPTSKESLQVQPTTPTSARQADINADREALGKAGFSTDDIRKWTELEAKANPNAIPKDDSGYKTGAWTDQETVNATAKLRELKSQIEALRKSGDDPETLVTLEDEFDNLTEAMYRSGTEQGRALASRRYTMDVDMSVDGLRARYKARAAKNGTKVDTKRIAELEQIAKDYKALKEQIDRKSPLDIDALTPNDPRLDPMHYDGLTDSSLYDPEFVNRAYVELFGDLPDDLPLDARAKAVREGLQDRINRAIEEDVRAANVDVLRDVRQWFRDARGGDGTSGWNVAVPGRNPGQWVAGPKVRMIDTQELPPEYLQMFIDWLPTRNKGAERYIRNGSTQDVNNRGLMGTVAEFDELIDRDGSRGVIPQAVVDEFVRDLTRMIGDDTGEVVVRRQRRVHLDSEFDDLLSQFKKAALSSANTGIPPELVPIVGKMVANRIKAGAASIEDIVIAIQKKFRERLLDPPERQDIIDAYAEYKATAKPEPNERAQKLREKRSKIEREMREESTQRKASYVAKSEEAEAKRLEAEAKRAEDRAKKAAERQQRIEADRKAKADQKAKARAEREAADAEAKALREEQERILGERKDWDKRNADKKRELERLNARIAELEKSIEAGTGEGPKTRKPSKEDADLARLRARQTMLQSKARAIYASTQPKGIADKAVGLLNVPRTIKASIDISAPGRQGWILGIGNPKAAGRAFADQMRALSTEEGAVMAQNAIMDRPNAPKYKAADLYLAPVDGSLNAKEEAFLGSEMFSRWKKFNPVRASDRAYAAYLNRLRADVFDNMVKGLGAKPTDEQLREIARYINIASGRGDIGGKGASEIGKTIGRAMPAAALGLWSPRNLISRIQFATGVPIAQAIKTPGARRLIAKEYAKSIIATGSVIGLAKLALERSGEGGVSGDISSSDFGKIRVGDTRVDIMAGVQQPLVLIGRLMTGKSTSPVSGKVTDLQNPKFGQAGPKELVSRFGWSKANPIFGSFEEFYTGKDFVGQPVGKGEALVNVIAPLSVKEIYEALTEEGIDKQDALVLLNIFGISTARFKDKEKAQP